MTRPPRYRRRRGPAVVLVVAVATLVVVTGAAWVLRDGRPDEAATTSNPPATTSAATSTPTPTPVPATTSPPAATATPTAVGIDLAAHSTTDPDSVWVVVNKQHPIDPLDHEPGDLVTVGGARVRAVVADDLDAMVAAAEADGVRIGLRTAYRSYGAQAAIRADVEARRGVAHAERYSARPGFSEHQTGLSFDVHGTSQPGCDLQTCFADTVEGQWVAAHAAEYGFLVRYTPENTDVTGFAPEAWHLRYVGRELAGWMAAQGVGSLEEALGVSGGPDYPAG